MSQEDQYSDDGELSSLGSEAESAAASLIQRRAFSLLSSPINSKAVKDLQRRFTNREDDLTEPLLGEDDVENKSSFLQATVNGLNILAGLGIISLPFAVKQSGWLVGIILLCYFSLLTNYTGKLIGRCMKSNSKIRTFPDLALYAYGKQGQLFITIVLSLEILFASSMLIAAMADHLVIVFPFLSRSSWAVVAVAVLYPSALTDKLYILSYLSLVGIATTFFLLIVLLETGVFGPSSNVTQSGSFATIEWDKVEAVGSFGGIIYSLGLQMVGFAGHTAFPTVYDSLREKDRFDQLLNIDYAFCFVLYFVMGFGGYFLYTQNTKEEVTLNFYERFPSDVLVKVCVWTIIINPTTKFALMLNALASVFEDNFRSSSHYTTLSIVLRTALCIGSLLITVFLPSFALICAFIGAFCSYIVSGICPIVCYLRVCKTTSSERRVLHIVVIVNIILCCLGTVAVFLPTHSS